MLLPFEISEHREAFSSPLNAQALESARRLLGIPELLALVLESFPVQASLVPAARVSRTWGELATAANWQRCWIDIRKLIMLLPPCNFYMTVRILQGEIEAGAVRRFYLSFAGMIELMMWFSTIA